MNYPFPSGLEQAEMCQDEITKQGIHGWLERIYGYYGQDTNCVDLQVVKSQIILNEKTVDYLYEEYTPLTTVYQTGSRPFLEKVLNSIINQTMTEEEKVLAIMRRCRDNRKNKKPGISFDGGSEEDILKAGKHMCNEISRVFCVLCQIAGIPARLVATHISGHMVNEVYFNQKWTWVDCRLGAILKLNKNEYASKWDLMQDPSILDRQPSEIWEDIEIINAYDIDGKLDHFKAAWQDKMKQCYLNQKEAIAIGNYFIMDHGNYDYPWHTDFADKKRYFEARKMENQIRKSIGFPDHFWDVALFQGDLILP